MLQAAEQLKSERGKEPQTEKERGCGNLCLKTHEHYNYSVLTLTFDNGFLSGKASTQMKVRFLNFLPGSGCRNLHGFTTKFSSKSVHGGILSFKEKQTGTGCSHSQNSITIIIISSWMLYL